MAAWQTTVGTIASTAGLSGFAFTGVQGAIAGYQAFVSPYASLTKSETKLKMVRSRLQDLSPKRREEIEIALRSGSTEFTSLEHLENQLSRLLDKYDRLNKRCEDTTFTERHYPRSEFRRRLSRFEELVKALLNDTLSTTVPCLNDIEFDPESPTRATERPSSSESTFKPESSTRATERPSISKSTFNPENSRWTMKGSPSSESTESFNTARESFSDCGGIPLSRMV